MSQSLKRLVLDVLKPHKPNLPLLAENLSNVKGVEGVNLSLVEIDKHTENIKITIEGNGVIYQDVVEVIEKAGGTVHSVDEVAAGTRLIEDVETPQDR